jgi:hypothetical protein
MSFGTWNVRSLYRPGSLMTVARELAKYKLDLVGVQEVRCIILKWIFKRWDGAWTGLSWLRIGTGGGLL